MTLELSRGILIKNFGGYFWAMVPSPSPPNSHDPSQEKIYNLCNPSVQTDRQDTAPFSFIQRFNKQRIIPEMTQIMPRTCKQ